MLNSGRYAIAWAENFTKIDQRATILYPYQKKFLLDQSDYRIVLKSRQTGYTLTIGLEGLFEALTNPEYTVLYVSSSEEAAIRIINYCYKFINSLEQKPKLIFGSKTQIKFVNGSMLVSLPQNPSTIVGYRAHRVYIDEFAHHQLDKEILESIEPSISRGGKLTIISTPIGRANSYWRIWEETQEGKSEYSPHVAKYTECPDKVYVQKVERMRNTMTRMAFAQAFECDPTSDSLAFFPPDVVKPCINPNLKSSAVLDTENHKYMGWDFAKVDDSSYGVGIENVNGKAIFRYWKELKPQKGKGYSEQLANEIYPAIDLFEPMKVFVDATTYGSRIFEELKNKYGEYKIQGINFTSNKKEELIMNLRKMFEQQEIVIPNDDTLLKQLYSLEKSLTETGNVRYKHAGTTTHDDSTWATSLAVYPFIQKIKEVVGKTGRENVSAGINERLDKDYSFMGLRYGMA